MKKYLIKVLILLLVLIVPFQGTIADSISANEEKDLGKTTSTTDYAEYLLTYQNAPYPETEIMIAGGSFLDDESIGARSKVTEKGNIAYTDEQSDVVWEVYVEQAGLYQIKFDYFPTQGKGGDIQRSIEINGKLPFSDAAAIIFNRIWTNKTEIETGDDGNEYRPEQVESPQWMIASVEDPIGYIDEPYYFYFEEGVNSIRIFAVNEPMAIAAIYLYQEQSRLSYSELLELYEANGYQKATDISGVKIQGEHAKYKSDPTLYPIADRTSSITENTDVTKIRLNTVGGNNWRYSGQWLTWEVSVEEDGLYEIDLRCKQNYAEGTISTRTLYIDGKIPFKEAKNIEFGFSYDWKIDQIGGTTPYLFYFSKGKTHTITLKNSLGYLNEVLAQAQQSVRNLNEIYRKLKMILGSFPDPNRDYHIEKQLPECIVVFSAESKKLKQIANTLVKKTGAKGSNYALFQKLFLQIDSFVEDSSTIPVRMDSLSTNISSLAGFVQTAAEQPLLIDYIHLNPPGKELPDANDSFFQKFTYEVKMFFYSFFSDYNNIGEQGQQRKKIGLWVSTGRDQAQVIKSLIDNSFSPKNEIGVEVRLVNSDVLLPAVAANKGPDVAIGQDRSMPVNYGLRSALVDLAQFEDLSQILKRFNRSAYEPYYVQDHLYALPETENFLMMYYRTDVLNSLNIDVPQTWDDLYNIIFELHQNNLDIGFPNVLNINENQIDIFLMLLFQKGGNFYNSDKSSTELEGKVAITAFEQWADLYIKYKITGEMNHLTRFRSGEAPIVIQPLTFYNLLSITAPEIRGLWEMVPVLGTKKEDGEIDRSIGSTGTGAVIFSNSQDIQSSWTFLKWWTSAPVQVGYSREMESLQGPSGRVITANVEAFGQLSWPTRIADLISEQRKYIQPFPEVPGSYIVNRYVNTAIRTAINTGGDAREILYDWNKKINNEIRVRREEFHLK